MKVRVLANRYARALLDFAVADGDPRSVETQLADIVVFFNNQPALRKALVNPAVPASRRRLLLSAILARVEDLSPLVGRVLLVMAERGRLVLLPELLAAYRERLTEHFQMVTVQVTTALPLSSDRADALARRLAEVTGKQVSVVASVDPAIIGGVVARIGSLVYDGSVARQLALMKERLGQAM